MVLKRAEVHKYVFIQQRHNFLCMMHWWKIAYDMIIVSIEILKCYIGFYFNCTTTWDARVSTRLRLYIILGAMKGLRSSNSKSFYENILFLKWIGILGCRDYMLISYGYDPQVLVRIIWSIQIVLKMNSFYIIWIDEWVLRNGRHPKS